MKKIILICIVVITNICFLSCSSDKSASQATQIKFSDFKEAFYTSIQYTNNGTLSTKSGYVTIDNQNKITINLVEGVLRGTAQETENTYNLTITDGEGIFRNITDVTGSLNRIDATINMNGMDMNGTHLVFAGTLSAILGDDVGTTSAEWAQNHTKSAFYFTNYGNCTASITMNGITLHSLQPSYYNTAGQCIAGSGSNLITQMLVDVDTEDTRLLCNKITLRNMTGSGYTTWDRCETAKFIVDKDHSYQYNITWENGSSSSGTTSQIMGGRQIGICIGASGDVCDGTSIQPGTTNIFLDGATYTVGCSEYNVFPGCTSVLNKKSIIIENSVTELMIYNIENACCSYNFVPNSTGCDLRLYGFVNNEFIANGAVGSGTFSWTGTKSFSVMYSWTSDDNQTHNLSINGMLP